MTTINCHNQVSFNGNLTQKCSEVGSAIGKIVRFDAQAQKAERYGEEFMYSNGEKAGDTSRTFMTGGRVIKDEMTKGLSKNFREIQVVGPNGKKDVTWAPEKLDVIG